MKRAFGKILLVYTYILVIFSVYVFAIALSNGRIILKTFGYQSYSIITNSMAPMISSNDLVIVKKTDVKELKEGDIITFIIRPNNKEYIITHFLERIIEIEGKTTYRTRAYGKTQIDPWILDEFDIIGKYHTHISKAGYVVNFIKSPIGYFAIIANMTIFVCILKIKTCPKVKKG